jgi:hypothetical protein
MNSSLSITVFPYQKPSDIIWSASCKTFITRFSKAFCLYRWKRGERSDNGAFKEGLCLWLVRFTMEVASTSRGRILIYHQM